MKTLLYCSRLHNQLKINRNFSFVRLDPSHLNKTSDSDSTAKMITYNPFHFYSILENPIRYPGQVGSPGITAGTEITIIGRVLAAANRFDINLCKGHDGRIKVLHFNPRFAPNYVGRDANVVVRNTLSADGWGNEERQSPPFPFLKGKCFKLVIRCGHDHFQISVDGQSFIDYKHRHPLKDISFLEIVEGVDISIIEVTGPK